MIQSSSSQYVTFLSKKKAKYLFLSVILGLEKMSLFFWLILNFAAKACLPNVVDWGVGDQPRTGGEKKGKIKNGITRVYRTLKKLGENQKQI